MKQLIIQNVKKLKDNKFEWPEDATLLMLKGSNQIGKSTFEQVLRTVLQVKNTMKDTTTKGEKSSRVLYKALDKNNNPLTVEWTHVDGVDKFKCSIIDGGKIKKVSAVNSIRDILGNHFRYSVQDIFNLVSTNEGKKKFMDEFVLALMNNEDKENYLHAMIAISSKKSKSTENNVYFKRRDANSDMALLAASLSDVIPWNDKLENELKTSEEKSNSRVYSDFIDELNEGIRKSREKSKSIIALHDDFLSSIKSGTKSLNDAGILFDEIGTSHITASCKTHLTKMKAIRTEWEEAIIENEKNIELANKFLDRTAELKATKANYDRMQEKRESYEALDVKVGGYNIEIEKYANTISDILARTKLPEGLEVIDGDIKLHGLSFDELSVSDSEARLAVVQLLSVVNTSNFIDIGDTTIYDKNSMDTLLQIADDAGCTLISQQVTNDNDLSFEIINHG